MPSSGGRPITTSSPACPTGSFSIAGWNRKWTAVTPPARPWRWSIWISTISRKSMTRSASMGITFYPHDAGSLRELMQNADLAMYAAKERGKYQVAHFQPSMQARAILRRELGRDLAVALEEDQFHLVYQPIVRLQTGRIEKVECLLRWEHPHKGAVSPGVFVPFAEDSGLISRIGEWVFRSATLQVATWRRICPGLQASINVSPVQFAGQNLDAAA